MEVWAQDIENKIAELNDLQEQYELTWDFKIKQQMIDTAKELNDLLIKASLW